MCQLVKQLDLGLDVVSEGELYTASQSGFPAERICMHGNNKSEQELRAGLSYGDVLVVVDNDSELEMLNNIASSMENAPGDLLQVTPGVETQTHQHTQTGQHDSKFGIPLAEVPKIVRRALQLDSINLIGLHAHIGSQVLETEPNIQTVDIWLNWLPISNSKWGLNL